MKFGIEVEGTNLGTRTIFCLATEIDLLLSDEIQAKVAQFNAEHIYVSDHDDTVTQQTVNRIRSTYLECFITIETQGMPKVRVDPITARYMIAYPTEDVERFKELSSLDQIKFTHGHNVLTISGRFDMKTSSASLHFTVPEDFAGDIVL